MSKNKLSGFTIFELILTTVMIGVIMIVAPVVMLQRKVKPAKKVEHKTIAECTSKCIFMAEDNILVTSSGRAEKFDYNKNSKELYTIQLVGGGGGGTDKSVGYPGESKELHLLSLADNEKSLYKDIDATTGKGVLTGYFLMEVGGGGNPNKSGSPSVICAISKAEAGYSLSSLTCNGRIPLAKAEGGITSIETGKDEFRLSKYSGIAPGSQYGNGGGKQQKGYGGIIIIR